jgi:hypothetical protein
MSKQNIEIKVYESSHDTRIPAQVDDFRAWVDDIVKKVPPQFCEQAHVSIKMKTGPFGDPYVKFEVSYFRAETDEEEQERELYLRLKRKYER